MAGQIEGELGKVAGVDAEVDVGAVQRAVEELAAIANDEIAVLRPVA